MEFRFIPFTTPIIELFRLFLFACRSYLKFSSLRS